MACSKPDKKRKVDSENREFKTERTDSYAFVLPVGSTKPMCLICNETVAIVKSGNVKRHYDSKHGHFDHNYPLKSEHKKPFSDSEIVKECMNEIAIALFEGTQKDDIIQKINQISLSDSTAVKRTEVLAEDLLDQMKSAIKKAKCISLALDESTDNTDNAQLLVFVRFFDEEKGEFCEDVLGLTALHGHTRGDDIYEALIQMLRDREIDLKHVISIATDGAPCMTGRERGLVARLRAHHPDLIAYHCIIHQMVLCASLEEKYAEVMTTVMRLVNFLRASSALQHRLLRSFLTEVNAEFDDLLLHNNVRWLSKGKVLERFWTLRKELETFLLDQKSAKAKQFVEFMQNEEKMEIVAFLSDITSHLNDLNMKLQGKNNTVCNLTSAVCAFQKKLELFKCDLQQDLLHFPKLLNQTAGTHHHHNHAEFLDKLIKNFQTHFGDFPLGKQVLLCMENPFLVKNIAEFSTEALKICPWASAASLQSELIELQENLALQESLCDPTTFWTKMVPAAGVPSLQKVALQILTMFPSTYCCESAFSTMNMVKNKYRSTLSNEHLHQCLRLALTPFMPKFKELVAQKRCHFSH
ncbi:SCND3 protein, partial [Amia calva]|nr:SCND3 protein [Amia calva]